MCIYLLQKNLLFHDKTYVVLAKLTFPQQNLLFCSKLTLSRKILLSSTVKVSFKSQRPGKNQDGNPQAIPIQAMMIYQGHLIWLQLTTFDDTVFIHLFVLFQWRYC